jgi:hypothetical protein
MYRNITLYKTRGGCFKFLVKYYYENALASQNITAKPNTVWVADITTLKILDKSFHTFLCIDIHTNFVVAHLIKATTIDSKAIISVLTKANINTFKNSKCLS